MQRYFLTISYLGRDFNGWQIQKNTASTVQQILQEKMGMLLKEELQVVGCGRTDTGVNAKNFVAHFDSIHTELAMEKSQWMYKFNTVLPAGVAIHDIRPVLPKAHARFDAIQRAYFYYLSRRKDPFRDPFTWYFYGELDLELMNEAAAILKTCEDFSSFSKSNTQNKTNICKVSRAEWQYSGPHEIRFSIRADRFLRGMVRAIAGTLVLVGQKKISLQEFKELIEAKDRRRAGSNAPANALFFTGVKYPKEIYLD